MSDAVAATERATPARPIRVARRARGTQLLTLAAPMLVGLAPILWLWTENRAEFEPTVILRPAAVVALMAVGLTGAFRLLAGRLGAASLLASLAVIAIFSYGTQLDLLAALTGRTSVRVQAAVRLVDVAAIVLLVGGVTILARRGRDLAAPARALGTIAAIVIVLAVVRPFGSATDVSLGLDGAGPGLVDGGAEGGADGDGHDGAAGGADGGATPAEEAPRARPVPERAADDAAHPDVYYVVLDGYARADALGRHYGFDNSPFLAELRTRGFYVADESLSNYPYTYLSLASSLNARYLAEEIERDEPYRSYLPLIREAGVPGAFRERGYRYAVTRTVWAGTSGSPIADVLLGARSAFGNEFEAALVEQSLLRGLLPHPSIAAYHLAAFDALEGVAADPRPTFTLGHIVLPHPPYVFDRDGQVVLDISTLRGQWGGPANERGYLEQVRFVNDRLIAVIDTILARSDTRPIIILQGDHGTWSSRFDPSVTPHDVATERMSILNAYLVPDAVTALLYPSITPVNTFRAIDRGLFGRPVDLLPDESWYGGGGPASELQRYLPAGP